MDWEEAGTTLWVGTVTGRWKNSQNLDPWRYASAVDLVGSCGV